jgi:SAM-dependent methyltransferase
MNSILSKVEAYYSEKVKNHGTTSKGVDWNGEESQFLRFSVLSDVIREEEFSILDLGCGYGAFIKYLENNFPNKFDFIGFDISDEMIKAAKGLYPNYSFTANELNLKPVDYVVASGILNVKDNISNEDWKIYIFEQIDKMDKLSLKGFSFNALTIYSDKEYMKDHLYYADPTEIFDYCKRKFSRNVALIHDYELYEFSIIVRK